VTAGRIRAAETEQGFDFDERCVACPRPGAATTKSSCSRSAKRRAFADRPSRSVHPNRIAACDDFGDSDWLNAAIAVTKIAARPDQAELQPALRSTRAAIGRRSCESATERSRCSHRGRWRAGADPIDRRLFPRRSPAIGLENRWSFGRSTHLQAGSPVVYDDPLAPRSSPVPVPADAVGSRAVSAGTGLAGGGPGFQL
jgi:hypothetical protein